MKSKEKNEMFFKNIASLYTEREGKILKGQLEDLEKKGGIEYSSHLDKKVKNKITSLKLRQIGYKFMPVAACLLFFIFYFANPFISHKESITKDKIISNDGIDFVSAKLPVGYTLKNIDYDKNKTIYYIVNDTKNDIVLTTEESTAEIEKGIFQEIQVNETKVYGLVKNDFNVVTYEKDHILYTLTSKYNYKDLIELSKSLL